MCGFYVESSGSQGWGSCFFLGDFKYLDWLYFPNYIFRTVSVRRQMYEQFQNCILKEEQCVYRAGWGWQSKSYGLGLSGSTTHWKPPTNGQ